MQIEHMCGITLTKENLRQELKNLKDPTYFKTFYEKNLEKTKQQLAASVSKDILIVQTINAMDEIDKTANMLSKRLREWYALYAPEVVEAIASNDRFASLVAHKSKAELLKDVSCPKSMGAEISSEDVQAITALAQQIDQLFALKQTHVEYLTNILKETAPNITTLAGVTIAARLLSLAGSLKKMVNLPASTIQVLGAEKALFRHLRTGSRPPKYGILHEHPLVQKAKQPNKAKVARALAEKISIASKIDYFKGEFVGDKLLKQVEAKCK